MNSNLIYIKCSKSFKLEGLKQVDRFVWNKDSTHFNNSISTMVIFHK